MAFYEDKELGNIIDFEGDVIINSLGNNTKMGKICQSIADASGYKDRLVAMIKTVSKTGIVGEMLTTEGFNQFKHVLHIVLPHSENDKKYGQYKECIRSILNYCNYKNWHNVGIPLIGVGADKYNKEKVIKIIREMSEAYCSLYSYMNITLVYPTKEISEENASRLESERRPDGNYHDEEDLKAFQQSSKRYAKISKTRGDHTKYTAKYFDFTSLGNRSKVEVCSDDGEAFGIDDYINEYVEKRYASSFGAVNYKPRINMYLGYLRKGYKDYFNAGVNVYRDIDRYKTINKSYLIKIALALKMSLEEATDFINYFGFSFSYPGVSAMDDGAKELFKNEIYTIAEAVQFYKNNPKYESIFAKQK